MQCLISKHFAPKLTAKKQPFRKYQYVNFELLIQVVHIQCVKSTLCTWRCYWHHILFSASLTECNKLVKKSSLPLVKVKIFLKLLKTVQIRGSRHISHLFWYQICKNLIKTTWESSDYKNNVRYDLKYCKISHSIVHNCFTLT